MPTEKKAVKETQMTSVPGGKTVFIATLFMCFLTLSSVVVLLMSKKRAQVRLYEKKYSAIITALSESNVKEAGE